MTIIGCGKNDARMGKLGKGQERKTKIQEKSQLQGL